MKIRKRWLFGGLFFLLGLALSAPHSWAQEGPPLPDLVITDVVLTPETPKPLQIFDIALVLKNVGQTDAGAFRVALRINSTLTKRVQGLAAGASTTVTFSWFGPVGHYTLRAEVDAFKEVREANSDNNTLERAFVLADDPLPDLLIQSVKLTPQHPLPGTSATLEVTVGNVGLLATTSRASLRVKDGTTTLRTLFVDPLEPGQSQTFSVAWQPKLGENFLGLEVDTLKRIDELDESNNVLTQVVTISAQPPTGANLVVRNLELFPPNAAPGELVTIRATVVNVGRGKAQDFSAEVEADGTLLDTVSFSSLAPGAEGQIETTWVATAGERLIRVKADGPKGTVIETDETDNVSVTLVDIGSPLNRCGQLVYLQLDEEAAQKLTVILNLNQEQVFNTFMPKVKQAMETDFAWINIRLRSTSRWLATARSALWPTPPPTAWERRRLISTTASKTTWPPCLSAASRSACLGGKPSAARWTSWPRRWPTRPRTRAVTFWACPTTTRPRAPALTGKT